MSPREHRPGACDHDRRGRPGPGSEAALLVSESGAGTPKFFSDAFDIERSISTDLRRAPGTMARYPAPGQLARHGTTRASTGNDGNASTDKIQTYFYFCKKIEER